MRSRTAYVFPLLAGFFSAAIPFLVMAADAASSQPVESRESFGSTDCEMSQPALDAINSATAAFIKSGRKNSEAGDLIDAATHAAWPPECDSVRAKILAEKASGLLRDSEHNSHGSSSTANHKPLITQFDGQWEFGLNAEFIEQKGLGSASIFDSLIDDKYGLYVGKEFYRTDKWFFGGQLHVVTTNDDNIDDSGDLAFDSTSLFATARFEALPAVQFKLGLSRADYENVFERETGTGLAYGIGLTTGNDDFRVHWLDYEVHRIGGEEFETYSINLLVVFCVVGLFFGGHCF